MGVRSGIIFYRDGAYPVLVVGGRHSGTATAILTHKSLQKVKSLYNWNYMKENEKEGLKRLKTGWKGERKKGRTDLLIGQALSFLRDDSAIP